MNNLYHEHMNHNEKKVVDHIYAVVNSYCINKGITLAYDDRAEEFVEAIAKYVVESK